MKNYPRVLIAGTNSGCGKTTITCALLASLMKKEMKVSSFKCGPDYIDPMFHSKIIGAKSSNLDPYFFSENTLKYLFIKNAKHSDISIIEGVMGFYDGMSASTSEGSSYEVAKKIKAPVVLVLNCKGMAISAMALLKGYVSYKEDSGIKGVIFNNVSSMVYNALKEEVQSEFKGEIKVIGYVPKLNEELILKSRHLGLVTAGEVEDLKEKMDELALELEKTVDIKALISLANTAESLDCKPIKTNKKEAVNIAVPLDNAFCFYYNDNLELLKEMGANLLYFSPIKDKKLPSDIHGIYMGGGYPELYLKELSQNSEMIQSVKLLLKNNTPCIAECGAFMYLSKSIDSTEMVGFLQGEFYNTKKLSRFGYAEFSANKDCLLLKKGESIKGHEFHYYDSELCGDSFCAVKPNLKTWSCIFANDNLHAGFAHLHFYANLDVAENFYNKCIERKNLSNG